MDQNFLRPDLLPATVPIVALWAFALFSVFVWCGAHQVVKKRFRDLRGRLGILIPVGTVASWTVFQLLGRYLFFINNDTILRHQTSDIRHLVSRLETDDKIGMVCPKIRFAWGDNPIQFAGFTPLSRYTMRNRSIGFGEKDKGQYDTAHPTPYAHGAAMMAKREALEKVGFMPECYFLYYEELDWSMMFTRAGYSIWYEPACTIYHKESQATGQNSPLKTYYLTRNRLLFVKRNIQGLRRYITYTYLLLAVAPRDICRYILHRQFNLASATIKGIKNFILEK
jgi:GT2 family glycosyltransferase